MNNTNLRIAIILSEFNKFVGEKLLKGCMKGLKELRVKDIILVKVPGAFEIPLAAKKIVKIKKPDAIIALGCVIKGETRHFDYVCRGCVDGIMQVQLETEVPIIFEVLMVQEAQDAVKRASLEKMEQNKGYIAAISAVEMIYALKLEIRISKSEITA